MAGGPVRDVRHLGNALDELTESPRAGVESGPQVRGEESTLLDNGNVDLDTLSEVTRAARNECRARWTGLVPSWRDVADDRPIAGSRLGDARDAALEQVDPLADGLEAAQPLLDVMPRLLGESADRQYLVALLNPAESSYSGGTPLTFVTMNFAGGTLTMGEPVDTSTARGIGQPRYWKKVKGNPFHRGRLNVLTSTMAPDWSVSGNELANAWRSLRGRRLAGVAVIDIVALADLIALTGPLDAADPRHAGRRQPRREACRQLRRLPRPGPAQGGQPSPGTGLLPTAAVGRRPRRDRQGPVRGSRRAALRGLPAQPRGAGGVRRPGPRRRPRSRRPRLRRGLHPEPRRRARPTTGSAVPSGRT